MEKRKKKKRLTGLIHGYNFKIITNILLAFLLKERRKQTSGRKNG